MKGVENTERKTKIKNVGAKRERRSGRFRKFWTVCGEQKKVGRR